MPRTDLEDQLVKYLTDVHAIEEQALAQLRTAPDLARDPQIAAAFREHLVETEDQKRRVEARLEAHGAKPSKLKDTTMAVGGKGFVLFARSQPDTTGKLVAHSYSYEALERASYELLARVAERAGDRETATTARAIAEQEQAMADRLAAGFEGAAEVSLEEVGREDLDKQLVKYLADAHAIENQAIQLLERGPKIVGDQQLARIFQDHLEETRHHEQLVTARLEGHDAGPSRLQDAAMRLGALNWGAFFQAQPDTPGKLAAFAYAFEHLEIAGYELLARVARRAGDQETVDTAQQILAQERAAAETIMGAFDHAVEASLNAQAVA